MSEVMANSLINDNDNEVNNNAETFKKIHPVEFYRRFFEQGIRPDTRSLSEFRSTVVSVGDIASAHGSSLAKIGNTSILTGIRLELSKPLEAFPDQGHVVANFELPPMCSAMVRPGPPSERAQEISNILQELLIGKVRHALAAIHHTSIHPLSTCQLSDLRVAAERSPGLLDLPSLCIIPNQLCWCVYIDAVCLDDDGNALDACILSVLSALTSLRIPDLQQEVATSSSAKTPSRKSQASDDGFVALSKMAMGEPSYPIRFTSDKLPFSTTFASFSGAEYLFVDPTHEEETLQSGTLNALVSSSGIIYKLHKPGGTALSSKQIDFCIDVAQQRAQFLEELLRNDSIKV